MKVEARDEQAANHRHGLNECFHEACGRRVRKLMGKVARVAMDSTASRVQDYPQ
jgi:hypothetical protein